jgi:hypothetical protein
VNIHVLRCDCELQNVPVWAATRTYSEETMRKLIVTIAAAAACLAAVCLTNRADAMTVGSADAIRAAIADVAVIDQVHCRPGFWHHSFRPHDGCFRRGFIVGPRVFVGPRFRGGFRGGFRRDGFRGGFRGGRRFR